MKSTIDLAEIIKPKHEKKWIALAKDKSKVIAYDESLMELKNKIGDEKVVFMKIPPADVYLSL